ncbi:TD and POZ domain-containing protein 5 [Caerostris extrusa]|uniref:TD and POZ domain-containing protein 5 n=1 Tax=Caerostris extrusa TaxID=172846 RepID=A0AAV4MBC2_CAEEX|nr:TD and POZ domain-containing protein 5 [Caerostris extrusa]
MWKDGERSSKIAHSPKGPGLTLLTISSVFKVNILSLLSDYAPDEEFYLIANSRTQPQIKLTLFVDRIKKLAMVKVEKLNNSINLLSADICSQTKYETSTDNDIDYKSYVNGLLISLNLNSLFDTEVLYFPSDILTFRCRCTFTSGYDCEIIDETTCGLHLLTEIRREIPPEIPQKSKSSVSEATSDSPTALQDFKALFNDPVLSDVKIMTKTKTFPAHKMVLCARSAVFRAMLTNEMKEKSTEIIRIDDLEDNIVHHFLLFLYTDDIKNLLSDTVKELYYAADKYDVPLLKEKCTAFMKKNLSIKNACDLLQLADIHQDSCLKTFVEDFIFRQHKPLNPVVPRFSSSLV